MQGSRFSHHEREGGRGHRENRLPGIRPRYRGAGNPATGRKVVANTAHTPCVEEQKKLLKPRAVVDDWYIAARQHSGETWPYVFKAHARSVVAPSSLGQSFMAERRLPC